MHAARRKSWSPYTVGALVGALEVFAMLTAKKPLGITTPFEEAASLAVDKTVGGKAAEEEEVEINWEWALVGGVTLGSMLSSRLANRDRTVRVPAAWRRRRGSSIPLRYGAAALGGALMMFGARMAKGCTSGHGISGTMQLAASSWLFDPTIFATGAAVSKVLLGRKK